MKKTIIILSVLLAVSMLLNGILISRDKKETEGTSDTTTYVVVNYDTIRYSLPVVRDSVVVRYIRKSLPVANKDTADAIGDTENVTIPITQKTYSDSTYTAWVSGYGARLDSIKVYRQTQFMTRIIKEKKKEPPWGIGVMAGYGLCKDGFTPYIGVGLTYRLFSIGKSK